MGRFDPHGSSACPATTTVVFAGVSGANADRDSIRGHHDRFVCSGTSLAMHYTFN
jgi:hypothetical protein